MKKYSFLLIISVLMISGFVFAQDARELELEIDKIDSPVTVDGIDSEPFWTYISTQSIDQPAGEPMSPGSPIDLSASFKIAWNDKGLMLFVYVTDELQNLLTEDDDFFRHDNIQTYFYFNDVLRGGDCDVDGDIYFNQFNFNMLANGGEQVEGRYKGEWYAPSLGSGFPLQLDIDFAFSVTPGGYNLEAFFPWDIFAAKNQIMEDMEFGYEIAVGDADEAEFESLLFWNDDQDLAWNNHCCLGKLRMGKEKYTYVEDPTLKTFYDNISFPDSETLDLGYVKSNEENIFRFNITNWGAEDLIVNDITIQGEGFSLKPSSVDTLSKQQSGAFIINFNSPQTGIYQGNLTISSNDPKVPVFETVIQITSVEAEYIDPTPGFIIEKNTITDNTVDFGVIQAGDSKMLRLWVKNLGLETMLLTSIENESPYFYSYFNDNIIVKYGDSSYVDINFHSSSWDLGDKSGEIILRLKNGSTYKLNLTGFIVQKGKYLVVKNINEELQLNNTDFNFLPVVQNPDTIIEHEFVLTNWGSDSIGKINVSLNNDYFDVKEIYHQKLGLLDTSILRVSFVPQMLGSFAGKMTISGTDFSPVTVFLHADVVDKLEDPVISANLNGNRLMESNVMFDFGVVDNNQGTQPVVLSLKNNGGGILKINIGMAKGQFMLINMDGNIIDASENIEIEPYGSYLVIVSIIPGTKDTYSDTILVETNDQLNPKLNIGLTGTGIVSVKENIVKDFDVYPNPSSGELFFDKEDAVLNNIAVYSQVGVLMHLFSNIKGNSINLMSLSSGLYILKFSFGNEIICKRIVINK